MGAPTHRRKLRALIDDSAITKREHHLPHWQLGGSVYFVTFHSARGSLPPRALQCVCDTVERDDRVRYNLHIGVAMPDHVHLLMQPLESSRGVWFDLAEIMHAIKGISAKRINRLCSTTGRVWQAESYDRIIRNTGEYREKWNYIVQNPVRSGLVQSPDLYPYFIKSR